MNREGWIEDVGRYKEMHLKIISGGFIHTQELRQKSFSVLFHNVLYADKL